jgi:hypothetical protein
MSFDAKRLGLTVLLCLPLLCAAAEATSVRCEKTQLHPGAPAETRQFAFLVGDFAVNLQAWRDEKWTPPRPTNARWNGWYGLNGMAIVDEWYDPDPAIDPDGGRGINVRMYDSDEGLWKMMWISTSNKQVTDLRAQMVDGVLTMWQVSPAGAKTKSVFEVLDEDHWTRTAYVPTEKEDEWLPQFKLTASRIPCGQP